LFLAEFFFFQSSTVQFFTSFLVGTFNLITWFKSVIEGLYHSGMVTIDYSMQLS
jgi:hypothetical protein